MKVLEAHRVLYSDKTQAHFRSERCVLKLEFLYLHIYVYLCISISSALVCNVIRSNHQQAKFQEYADEVDGEICSDCLLAAMKTTTLIHHVTYRHGS